MRQTGKARLVYIDPDNGFGIVRTEHGNYVVDETQLKRAGLNKHVGVVDLEISFTLKLDSLPLSSTSSKDSGRQARAKHKSSKRRNARVTA